jgi:hypothetical protein
MRRSKFILLYAAALLIVASCRREAAAPQAGTTTTTPSSTSTTLTGTPQDLSNATVNTVIVPPDTAVYVDNARLGSAVGADGMVSEEKTEFARGEDVRLSMWFRQSPAGLQASVKLEDEAGKELDAEHKPMNGQKNVTFTVGDRKLKPGKYKVTGYWGGNIAAEYEFTVKR